MDFLRLVLAVVDDHARSQGHDKTAAVLTGAGGAASVSASAATMVESPSPSPSPLPSSTTASCGSDGRGGGVWSEFFAGPEVTGGNAMRAATASCLLSVEDLPRLYHGPGLIMSKLVEACKGVEPSGKVQ